MQRTPLIKPFLSYLTNIRCIISNTLPKGPNLRSEVTYLNTLKIKFWIVCYGK